MRPPDEEVFEKDNFHCVYCDYDGSQFRAWAFLQVDHFIPKSKGGTDDISNLVTSCCSCNHMKLDQQFSSIEAARTTIRTYWNQMEDYWKNNVAHRRAQTKSSPNQAL